MENKRSYFYTKKIILLFISGLMNSGKTTAANYISKELSGIFPGIKVRVASLADPIKEIAYRSFGWDGSKDERGRRLLQVLGTEAGREYNQNLWAEKLEDSIGESLNSPNVVIIDDWRFINELDYFKTEEKYLYDVLTARIKRMYYDTGAPATALHQSETSLPEVLKDSLLPNSESFYDFSLINNGTLGELYDKLDSIVAYLKTKFFEIKEI